MASIFDSMPDYQSFHDQWQSSLPQSNPSGGLSQDGSGQSWNTRTPFSNPVDYSSLPAPTLPSSVTSQNTGSGGGFFSNLWNGIKSGGNGILSAIDWGIQKPIDSVLTAGADFGNNIANAAAEAGDALGFSKLPRTFNGDAVLPHENRNVLSDLKNIWSSTGSSPDVAAQAMGGGTLGKVSELAGSLLFPGKVISAPFEIAGKTIAPFASDLNATLRGESGLADSIKAAQDASAQQAADSFNQALSQSQTQEAVNSAQKGNFSLIDMLNRTPEAQRTFIDTANDLSANQNAVKIGDRVNPTNESGDIVSEKPVKVTDIQTDANGTKWYQTELGNAYFPENQIQPIKSAINPKSVPSLFDLAQNAQNQPKVVANLSRQYPFKLPVEGVSARLQDSGRTANSTLQQLFDAAKNSNLRPGLEYESLQDMWSRMAPKEAGSLNDLIDQAGKYRTVDDILNNATQRTMQQFKYGVTPFQFKAPAPKMVFNAADESSPFAKQFQNIRPNNALNEPKPFKNPFASALDGGEQAQKLSDATENAKAGATLDAIRENAANKNPLQMAYSKVQDTLNNLFNLKGALGEKFPAYYQYLTNKDYRTGQAAKDIMDTLKGYTPQQLQEFRLARDAGEIGPGHTFENLNNAYDALLQKYTGGDVGSGLERNQLKNYVPRIMDVDKGNMQSVKRALGSDSLGSFAENRSDNRTLRQIIAEDGRDPYKNDMYDITLSRLQKSINAQESRNFISKMVNDGTAMKFENSNKAFTSTHYDKATTGVYVDPITKEAYLMPKDTAKFLNKEKDFSELRQYLGGLDAVNSIAKRMTLTNPLVHFPHNILPTLPYALHEAGVSGLNVLNPSFWAKGRNAGADVLDEMERMGVLRPEYMRQGDTAAKDLAHEAKTSDLSPARKYLADIKYQSTTGSPMERIYDTVNAAARPLDAFTWMPEHVARVAVYQTAKEMGATPEQAADIINRNFGTNTKTLTPFEKNVMNRAFTFYPWLKHILTWFPRAMVQHPDLVGKTAMALNGVNRSTSDHSMLQNPQGDELKIDTGRKDTQGNEIYVDPYLPLLEGLKFANGPAEFLYNRTATPISTLLNLAANKKYGLMSPAPTPIVDQAKADAGLQNPAQERAGYLFGRLFSSPVQTYQSTTGQIGNSWARSLLNMIGAHTSTYNPGAIAASDRFRGENAAKAYASDLRKQGLPVPTYVKRQESGKVPFQIQQ